MRRMMCMAGAAVWAAAAGAVEIHVAADGNDAWSGASARPDSRRTDGPVATLARARDAARALRASGPSAGAVTILVGPGTFALPVTLTLGPADSGTPSAPLTIRGVGGGRTILTGGRPVSNFVERAGGVLEADLAAAGLKGARFRQLVFDGRRMPLARHPDFDPGNPYGGGWAYADGERIPMYKDIPGESRRTFRMKASDIRPWSEPADGEVWVFPRYNWWNNILRIAAVDAASRVVTLKADASYPIRPGDRYFVQGMREDLDAPGEWWLDVTNSLLRFLPPGPRRGRPAYAPVLRTLVELQPGASSVRLERLVLECCEGTAVVMRETTNCVLAASEIRTVGDYHGSGVSVSDGLSNLVFGCDIHDTGSHGVSVSGGDRVTLTPAANDVVNCYIHHVGRYHGQGVGVALRGVGNRAAHNLIHDGPRMGIQFSGNNLIVEFNHIRHMNLETSDTGGTYTGGRDWISSRGSVLRYNFIHDILGYGEEKGRWVSPYYAWGIYEDDNAGGVDLVGNVIARCPRAAIHLHNGRDTRIANNILVDCGLAMVEYNGWTPAHRYWTNHLGTMVRGYESVAGSPAWRGMRNMDVHPTNAVQPDGTIMTGNEFVRNIVAWTGTNTALFKFRSLPLRAYRSDSNLVWHAGLPIKTGFQRPGMDEWEAWKALGFDSNSIVADPRFQDPAGDDYRPGWRSPASRIGFEPIPFARIGPYRDPLRASWPIREAEGARERPLAGGGAGS